MSSYINYFGGDKMLTENKVLLILGQLVHTLASCQKKGQQHFDIRPQTVFVKDHSRPVLGYFGKGKFMGKQFCNKDCLPYLAPKLI